MDHRSTEGDFSTPRPNILKGKITNGDISYGYRNENNSCNCTVDNDSNFSENILGSAKHPQFNGFHSRLDSFNGWSHGHLKNPRYFVEAGFYYTGNKDIVRCFYCDIGLTEWIPETDFWEEHACHSPNCLFVVTEKGPEFIENIQREWRKTYCPRHSEFEEYGARLESFVCWPSTVIQRPEELASSGFYYTGENDEVRCHYCDGALCGLKKGDNPWIEHARLFPFCKYLTKIKGDGYAAKIARLYNNNNRNRSASRTNITDNNSRARPRDEISVNLIDSDPAKYLLQMGYSRVTVKNAINEHIKRTGSCVFTDDEILDIIVQSEDS